MAPTVRVAASTATVTSGDPTSVTGVTDPRTRTAVSTTSGSTILRSQPWPPQPSRVRPLRSPQPSGRPHLYRSRLRATRTVATTPRGSPHRRTGREDRDARPTASSDRGPRSSRPIRPDQRGERECRGDGCHGQRNQVHDRADAHVRTPRAVKATAVRASRALPAGRMPVSKGAEGRREAPPARRNSHALQKPCPMRWSSANAGSPSPSWTVM